MVLVLMFCVSHRFLFVSAVVGEFLWLPVSGGLSRVPEGDAVCEYPPEPADLCPGRLQVPRAAQYSVSY